MKLDDIIQNKNADYEAFSSGFMSLDKQLDGGYYKGDLVSIWSTALMGTTAFLLSTAYYLAKQNVKVLYLTEQNVENCIIPRLKLSLNKLNFPFIDIPLYFETVWRLDNDTLENLYAKNMPEVIILDIKPNLQAYNPKLLKGLKLLVEKLGVTIIITTILQNFYSINPLQVENLWKRALNKKLFDLSDVSLVLYRRIQSLENMPLDERNNKENLALIREEINYYKQRIDVLCYKNKHGSSLWRRHFYFDDSAFILDKIPIKKSVFK